MKLWKISDNFRELAEMLNVDRFDHIAQSKLRPASTLSSHAMISGCSAGLIYQGEALGRCLEIERPASPGQPTAQDPKLPTLIQLKRSSMYAIAPLGHEAEVAEHIARAIADKHGSGRWWSTDGCVGYCGDDGMVRGGEIGFVRYVLLRAYYFHDPVAAAKATGSEVPEAAATLVTDEPHFEPNIHRMEYLCKAAKECPAWARPMIVQELRDVYGVALPDSTALETRFDLHGRPAGCRVKSDHLDASYDGISLRDLMLTADAAREGSEQARTAWRAFTPSQLAAVQAEQSRRSEAWSAELRKKAGK